MIQDQSLLVVDAVVNGEIDGFTLPGGNIGWAFGGQFRKIDYQTRVDNPLTNSEITPCPIPGDNSCALKTGPFIFLGQFINQNLKDDVYSAFMELAIPVTDSLTFQAALRYEDYGGLTGDTLDPKISGRWQATDWLAFRGSWGSTFRGPTPVNLSIRATGLQPLATTGGQYRSIDNFGNPDLKPESADTLSFGAIFQWEAFEFIVDYWKYEFKDQITTVPFSAVSNAVGNGPGTGLQLANCDHALRYLVTFDNNNTCVQGVTQSIQMQRILANVVNGSPVDVAGFDIGAKYTFDNLWGGEFTIGLDTTILDKYDVSAFSFGGVQIFGDYSAKGFANQERFPGIVSEMRALGYLNYNRDAFNFRYEVRFVKGVEDERPTPRVATATGATIPVLFGKNVDDVYTHNFYATWQTPWNLGVSFSVVNILDEDPPQVRHQLSYDPYMGDPLGRTFELGVKYTFGQD